MLKLLNIISWNIYWFVDAGGDAVVFDVTIYINNISERRDF